MSLIWYFCHRSSIKFQCLICIVLHLIKFDLQCQLLWWSRIMVLSPKILTISQLQVSLISFMVLSWCKPVLCWAEQGLHRVSGDVAENCPQVDCHLPPGPLTAWLACQSQSFLIVLLSRSFHSIPVTHRLQTASLPLSLLYYTYKKPFLVCKLFWDAGHSELWQPWSLSVVQ